jgi:uncharacterized protein YsxB (DUF464 family)
MIKMIAVFLILTVAIAGGHATFRKLNNQEKFNIIKSVGYGIMCAAISLVILSTIVVVF